jgi:hypothetical protein
MPDARIRYAIVSSRHDDQVANYLPSNYEVFCRDHTGNVVIKGHDNAGWTLDDYVIPRLLSGLMSCKEIKGICPRCGNIPKFGGEVLWCECSGWLDQEA